MTTKVFLHTCEARGGQPRNEPREFLRLPVAGEFVTTEPTGSWYEVDIVVHSAFDGKYAADVFAHKVDFTAVLSKRWPGLPVGILHRSDESPTS